MEAETETENTDEANYEITEGVDILSRDGAIAILSEMRATTHGLMTDHDRLTQDPTLASLDELTQEIFGQLYGMQIILSGVLGDATVGDQMKAHIAQMDAMMAEAQGVIDAARE